MGALTTLNKLYKRRTKQDLAEVGRPPAAATGPPAGRLEEIVPVITCTFISQSYCPVPSTLGPVSFLRARAVSLHVLLSTVGTCFVQFHFH